MADRISKFSHQLKRPKPKTLLIVGSIVGVASAARYWVYNRASDALLTADALNRQRISEALEDDERRRNPKLDYDRVMRGVLEEEARIEREAADIAAARAANANVPLKEAPRAMA